MIHRAGAKSTVPALANRLIRNWYAHDERYHGELRARAEAEPRAYGTASQMRQMSGEHREVEWVKGETVGAGLAPPRGACKWIGCPRVR